MSLAIVTDLLAAIADAHTPRAMARALASGLATHASIVRLELRVGTATAMVERDGDDWRATELPHRKAIELAPGLSVVSAKPLPRELVTPEMRAALEQVVHTAARHLEVVQRVAELSRRAHVENRELREDLQRMQGSGDLIARSPQMREVLARVQLVAVHPTTVLITGESGVGKDVVAREIHARSPRASRPFVAINCAVLPEALIESELFGHERGAFTGAEQLRVGVFEKAHRGTLFLDEVGELSPATQAKLLRVLQEGAIRRVGGTETIEVDVRIIAATNRNLHAMVADGRFREDLLYRLDVFSIHIAPLRERPADLAPLASAIIRRVAARWNVAAPPLGRATLAKLAAHDWPGNVRQLSNVLETALVFGNGRALELPVEIELRRTELARFERAVRETIEESLRATRGKIYGLTGAAARLGLKPATLQSKMKKLGIERRDFCR